MADEKINYRISTVGGDQASQQFGNVAKSIGGAEKASTSFTSKVSGANTSLGALSMALGAADPKIGFFVTSISLARTAVTGLVTALGGVGGLAAGLAAGGAIAAIHAFGKSQNEAAKAAENLTRAMEAQNAQWDALAQKDVSRQMEVFNRYAAQRAQSAEIGSDIRELESQLTGKTGVQRWAIEDRIKEARARQAAAQKKEAEDAAKSKGGALGGARSGRGETEFDRAQAVDRQLAALDKMQKDRDDERVLQQLERDREAAGVRLEAKAEALNAEFELENSMREESFAKEQELYEKKLELSRSEHDARKQMLVETAGVAATSFGQQLAAMSRGQKVNARLLAASVGEFMVVRGTQGVLESAMLATNPFTLAWAPSHLQASLAMIAGGMVLGAASSAGGGGGRASGGGGIGVSRPITGGGGGGGDSGGGTTYITVTMPSVVSPGPADGERVAMALERANAVNGTVVSRRVVQA